MGPQIVIPSRFIATIAVVLLCISPLVNARQLPDYESRYTRSKLDYLNNKALSGSGISTSYDISSSTNTCTWTLREWYKSGVNVVEVGRRSGKTLYICHMTYETGPIIGELAIEPGRECTSDCLDCKARIPNITNYRGGPGVYEILSGCSVQWIPFNSKSIPSNAVKAGWRGDDVDKNRYICRVKDSENNPEIGLLDEFGQCWLYSRHNGTTPNDILIAPPT